MHRRRLSTYPSCLSTPSLDRDSNYHVNGLTLVPKHDRCRQAAVGATCSLHPRREYL